MSAAPHTPGPLVVDSNTAELPFRVFSQTKQGNVAYFYCEADAKRFAAHEALVKGLKAAIPLFRSEYLELAGKYAGTPVENDPTYKAIKQRYEDARTALQAAGVGA